MLRPVCLPNRNETDLKMGTNNIKNLLIGLLLLLTLSACSSTVVYRQLDWLIPWYIDGLVDISGDQKDQLKEKLEPALRWHREEELARYIEIFNHIESDLKGPVTAEQAAAWIAEGEEAIRRVEARFLEVGLEMGSKLSDEQMEEFGESLWEKHHEFEQEYLPRSDEEYTEEMYDYLVETTQSFTGRLNADQKSVYRDVSEHIIRFDGVWLQDREAWLREIEPWLLRPPGWKEALRRAHLNREAEYSDEYHRIYQHNLAVATQGMADVLNQRTPRQSERLQDEIDDWRERLTKMMKH